MKNFLSLSFLFFALLNVFSQTEILTFTGCDENNNWVQLDSIAVTNLTRGWQEILYWPDTVLKMQVGVEIDDNIVGAHGRAPLQLEQNNPNPFNGVTDVALQVADAGAVTLEMTDMNGRAIVVVEVYGRAPLQQLTNGPHNFRITVADAGTYILTARQNGKTVSIKMVNNGGGNGNRIEYIGTVVAVRHGTSQQNGKTVKSPKLVTTKPFNFGDLMEYVGYATINDNVEESQRIIQQQGTSQKFTLQFDVTQMQLATVTTSQVSGIIMTKAVVGGTVISDGGTVVIDRGVCWDTTANPTIADNSVNIGSGTGTFSDTLTNLTQNTTYFVRAYARNSIGVAYGAAVSFTTPNVPQDYYSCPETPIVTDADNNVYNTVQIGNWCWMRENLRTTKYADETSILQGGVTSTTVAYWYYPDNDSANKSTYGLLYNWIAVMHNSFSSNTAPSGVQGICPIGWHVPSDEEWMQFENYVSSQNQYVCATTSSYIAKSLASKTGWNTTTYTCAIGNNPSNNNTTVFSALPAGNSYNGSCVNLGFLTLFWTSTDYNGTSAYSRYFDHYNPYVSRPANNKGYAFSVRCLKD